MHIGVSRAARSLADGSCLLPMKGLHLASRQCAGNILNVHFLCSFLCNVASFAPFASVKDAYEKVDLERIGC